MKPEYIIVHFSESTDRGGYSIELIDRDHKKRGFQPRITPTGKKVYFGYHCYINRWGAKSFVRPTSVNGQHCKGYNDKALGICVEGLNDVLNDDTFQPLLDVVRLWMIAYKIPVERVLGHKEADPSKKSNCPNFDMNAFREILSNLE